MPRNMSTSVLSATERDFVSTFPSRLSGAGFPTSQCARCVEEVVSNTMLNRRVSLAEEAV